MRRAISAGLACGLTLAMGGQAQAAVTIGSDLTRPAAGGLSCDTFACTIVQAALAGSQLTAPSDGVIVRWRIRSLDVGNEPVALQVVSGSGASSTGGAASAPPENMAAGVNTFSTRLPIEAGDHIGVQCCAFGETILGNTPGASIDYWGPILTLGETRAPSGTYSNYELLLNADIEVDADRDFYGDETQDLCPTDPSRHTACLVPPDTDPPETTITKRPPNKSEKTRAKYKFGSDEPGSTFECKKDKKPWKPCSSPTRMKHLDEGRHKFKVRAIDAAGNVDPTPSVDKFKVVG